MSLRGRRHWNFFQEVKGRVKVEGLLDLLDRLFWPNVTQLREGGIF